MENLKLSSNDITETRHMWVTPYAYRHILGLLKIENQTLKDDNQIYPQQAFRVRVDSGGCKGFQYVFSFASVANCSDPILECNGIKVIVDDLSLDLIKETTIDYKEELISSGFHLKNPNASSSCGCNNSFTI